MPKFIRVSTENERIRREGFEEGRRFERLQGLFFAGVPECRPWTYGVAFKAADTLFESQVAYERDLRAERQRVQRGLWLLRKDGEGPEGLEPLEEADRAIAGELAKAKGTVDEDLHDGRRPPYAVAAMRCLPQRPAHVVELESLDAFVASDERRKLPDWPQRKDAGGADFGAEWQRENPFRRWETTSWRLSWLGAGEEPTLEVYALELLRPGLRGGRRTGRVWLLGSLPDWRAANETLGVLQLNARRERNSLVLAAEAVRVAARGEPVADLARRLAMG